MTNPLLPLGTNFSTSQELGILPIRGEKRLIPIQLDWSDSSVSVSNALPPLLDFMTIRIPQLDGSIFVYRFLINPKTISVAHQTLDSHSMTRSGWQFGVWGEDTIDLHISGTTGGQYVTTGLSDSLQEYTLSYRNGLELMNVFENNGYYFEGSAVTQGDPLAADYARKRIKCHQDVEIRVGNFIWKGMFTTMSFNSSAENPYLVKFDLGFLAWKEDYSNTSPWRSPIPNNVYRGHSQEVVENIIRANETANTIASLKLFPQHQLILPQI